MTKNFTMTTTPRKLLPLLAALTALLCLNAAADEIDLGALGELELSYMEAAAVTSYPGQSIVAAVNFRQGEAYTLTTPRAVQQIHYLVEVGERVERGQAFAELHGPEIHHFMVEVDVAKKMLASAERRFNSNKVLYEKKAIKESQWIEISKSYYAAQLEYEHLRHFSDLVITGNPKENKTEVNKAESKIIIGAPISGVLDYSLQPTSLKGGDKVAAVVPESSIRLSAAVPFATSNQLSSFVTPSCQLAVSSVASKVQNYFVSAWSVPIEPECKLTLGQALLATPRYKTQAYKVPMSSVFEWQQATSVLIRNGEQLQVVAVALLASDGADYIVTAQQPLQNKAVLTTSVSAVQGVLLGLGGE